MSDVSVATDVACGSASQVDRHVIADDVAFGAAPGVATDNRKGCNHMLMFAVILATLRPQFVGTTTVINGTVLCLCLRRLSSCGLRREP